MSPNEEVPYQNLREQAQKPMDWEDRCKKLQEVLKHTERQLVNARVANRGLKGILSEIEAIIARRYE